MLEKEAEEYGHEHCCDSCKNLQARYRKVFKDGAELGYNKADTNHQLVEQLAKQNEQLTEAKELLKEINANSNMITCKNPYADENTNKTLGIFLRNWFDRVEEFLTGYKVGKSELKAQIEKTKGCSNCKYVTSNIENQSHCSKCGGNHSEWKLKRK